MVTLTLSQIAEAVGGRCVGEAEVHSVCIDSRSIRPGCLFIAIIGERLNGHRFVSSAMEQGAAAAMVSEEDSAEGIPHVVVGDTGEAFLKLARYYKERLHPLTVGITGSVGKTTTKEMTAAVLSRKYKTRKTEGNLNNQIGLPRTIMELEDDDKAAVIEMGMSGKGEISSLSQTAQPDIGVITSIGVSHIESLGSREGIFHAKLELIDGMKPGSPLIVCGDNDLLSTIQSNDYKIIFYGIENRKNDYTALNVRSLDGRTSFEIKYGKQRQKVIIPAIGIHNVYNALAAFAVGIEAGVSPAEAAEGLKHYIPSGMRQRIVEKNGVTVIEDCYNASTDSMKAALSALCSLHVTGRRIAVLADMLELGEISEQEHFAVGKLAAESGIDLLLAYGDYARFYVAGARSAKLWGAWGFEEKEEIALTLAMGTKPGDAILFKASRGMKMEELIYSLYERWEKK